MKLLKAFTLLFISIALFTACNDELKEIETVNNSDAASLKRMPFNQRVFLLNNVESTANVYEVNYDFQGLSGDAKLSFVYGFEGRSHMTVTPDGKWLCVVNNGMNGINRFGYVHFYNITSGELKTFDLRTRNKYGKITANAVSITQADFDRKGRLFIAGSFYQVVPADPNYDFEAKPDFWNYIEADNSIELTTVNYLKSANNDFNFSESIEAIDEDNDGIVNEYFSNNFFNIDGKVKFVGGDITFTQNSIETGGFEEEQLITFTRAYNGAAVKVIFGENNGKVSVKGEGLFKLKYKNVTGAALMGDNHAIVSTQGHSDFVIYSLDGTIIDEPIITFSENTPADKIFALTSAGDMATSQVFDNGNLDGDYGIVVNRMIDGEYTNNWLKDSWNLAEIKLYRPQPFTSDNFENDNPGVNTIARMNSANCDIADFRKASFKFASLGAPEGYAVLKLRKATTVGASTKLQVVESTWGAFPKYTYPVNALNKMYEMAKVYVYVPANGSQPMYVNDSWVEDNNWVEVGQAYIAENVYTLSDVLPIGASVQWIKIVDNGSTTPDGFDINFVSTFE